jgi:hypothetical protein
MNSISELDKEIIHARVLIGKLNVAHFLDNIYEQNILSTWLRKRTIYIYLVVQLVIYFSNTAYYKEHVTKKDLLNHLFSF